MGHTHGAELDSTGSDGAGAAGLLGILGGIALIVSGLVTWIAVSVQLGAERITIPPGAPAFAGRTVAVR